MANKRHLTPRERQEVWQALALSPIGKRAIEDLYEVLGARRSVFHNDPATNAYRQGRQSVAYFIADQIAGANNHAGRSTDTDRDPHDA